MEGDRSTTIVGMAKLYMRASLPDLSKAEFFKNSHYLSWL